MDKHLKKHLKTLFPNAKILETSEENTFCVMDRIANAETILKLKNIGFSRIINSVNSKKTPFIFCYFNN